jgi:NAD(P)-dependent dehydrogenase (short-subunit alcohol dehydrogenase family)
MEGEQMIESADNQVSNPFDFTGQVAVVTGGGGGIGKAIAAGLAAHGAQVIIADYATSLIDAAVDELQTSGASVSGAQVDVTNSESVKHLVEVAEQAHDAIDILVNCAGVASRNPTIYLDETDWRRTIEVNLTGPFLCCKEVIRGMAEQHYGRIINVASVAALRTSYNGSSAYTASKAGLVGFTRHFAYEVAPDGVTVNAICPGPTLTPMIRSLADDAALAERAKSVPIGRMIDPADHMGTVLFLASPLASAICGAALAVDGGALLGWTDTASYLARRTRPMSDTNS